MSIWAIGEGVANLTLSITLVHWYGIYGVAIGTLIPSLVVQLGLWPRYINQLVGLARTVKAAGGEMLLAAPHPNLARLFEIVNIDELMPVVASLEAAIERAPQADASPGLVQEQPALPAR